VIWVLDAPREVQCEDGELSRNHEPEAFSSREVNMAGEQPTGKRNAARYAGLGVALGAGVGTAIGVATGDLEVWLAVGVAVGAAVGVTLSKRAGRASGV
jgi:hypothetical protein